MRDNDGGYPLHIAATEEHKMMLHMVDMLLTEPYQPVELVIEAFELTALSWSCKHPFECMMHATRLRMEHNIPKRTFEPMKCYGYPKEWETIEELEKYGEDAQQLTLQAILARERIHKGLSKRLMEFIQHDLIQGKKIHSLF